MSIEIYFKNIDYAKKLLSCAATERQEQVARKILSELHELGEMIIIGG
jgi:hypothetical protein